MLLGHEQANYSHRRNKPHIMTFDGHIVHLVQCALKHLLQKIMYLKGCVPRYQVVVN